MTNEEHEAISNLVGKSRKVARDRNFAPTREELLDASLCSEDCEHCDRYDECYSEEEGEEP